jgi:hypothetical protein
MNAPVRKHTAPPQKDPKELLLALSSVCAGALACIDEEDVDGLLEKLELRQEILDELGRYPSFPAQMEDSGLIQSCLAMDQRLLAAAKSLRDKTLARLQEVRAHKKMQDGYGLQGGNKGMHLGNIRG